MKKQKKLFEEFPKITADQWEQLINKDLKGADYKEKLFWKTEDEIELKPYYRREDLPDTNYSFHKNTIYPFCRDVESDSNEWEIRQDIIVDDVKKCNKHAIYSLMKGATALQFDLLTMENLIVKEPERFQILLKDLYFDGVSLTFKTGPKTKHILKLLEKETIDKKIDTRKLDGAIDFDPFNELVLTGNFYESLNKDFILAKNLIEYSVKKLPGYRMLGVNGLIYKNSGASVTQELAYCLAAANEYLTILTEKGIPLENIVPRIQFNFGIGSDYFLEIAKLRAARFLWSNIVKAYNDTALENINMYIHSTTSCSSNTIYDPYSNLLRTTTEAMSAILGGTDSLTIQPYDFCFTDSSKFSERIAQNIQHILKKEAYFSKVADPANGSYYIENLTHSIAKETWKIFQTIERKGGFIIAFMEGYMQKEIQHTLSKRLKRINEGTEILVGTNKYPVLDERKEKEIQKKSMAQPVKKRKKIKLGKPLLPIRLSEELEAIRMQTENTNPTPSAFLFSFGDIAKSKFRSSFLVHFLGCGGFKIIDHPHFTDIEEGIKKVKKVKPDIVVLCSSDEDYATTAPKLYKALKEKFLIIVAGFPKESIETLKKTGIKYFIHMQSNMLETLRTLQEEVALQ